MLRDAGEWHEVITLEREAREVARQVRAAWPDGATSIWRNLAQAHDSLKHYQRAIAAFEQVGEIAREQCNRGAEGGVCGQIGRCYQAMGAFRDAIAQHERRLTIAKEVGNRVSEGLVLGDLGRCYQSLCQYEKALEMLEESKTVQEETGNKLNIASAHGDIGDCFAALGKHDLAIEAHEKSLHIISQVVNKNLQGQASVKLGVSLRCLARDQDCRQDSDELLAKARDAFKSAQALFVATGREEQHCTASIQLALTIVAQVESTQHAGAGDAADGLMCDASLALTSALAQAEHHGLVSATSAALLHLSRVKFWLGAEAEGVKLLKRHVQLALEVQNWWCSACGLLRHEEEGVPGGQGGGNGEQQGGAEHGGCSDACSSHRGSSGEVPGGGQRRMRAQLPALCGACGVSRFCSDEHRELSGRAHAHGLLPPHDVICPLLKDSILKSGDAEMREFLGRRARLVLA